MHQTANSFEITVNIDQFIHYTLCNLLATTRQRKEISEQKGCSEVTYCQAKHVFKELLSLCAFLFRFIGLALL